MKEHTETPEMGQIDEGYADALIASDDPGAQAQGRLMKTGAMELLDLWFRTEVLTHDLQPPAVAEVFLSVMGQMAGLMIMPAVKDGHGMCAATNLGALTTVAIAASMKVNGPPGLFEGEPEGHDHDPAVRAVVAGLTKH